MFNTIIKRVHSFLISQHNGEFKFYFLKWVISYDALGKQRIGPKIFAVNNSVVKSTQRVEVNGKSFARDLTKEPPTQRSTLHRAEDY